LHEAKPTLLLIDRNGGFHCRSTTLRSLCPTNKGYGLSPGLLLTPLLQELYLHQLDIGLQQKHIPFVRVIGDLMVFGREELATQNALSTVEKQLRQLSLSYPPDDGEAFRSSAQYYFLGRRLTAKRTTATVI